MEIEQPSHSTSFAVETIGLEVAKGHPVADFQVPSTGLTLIHTKREQAATSLSLALAGRFQQHAGTISIATASGMVTNRRDRFRHVALAGVTEIDALERLVPVRTTIREQSAWTSPWWARTPRSIDHISEYQRAAQRVSFALDDAHARNLTVGELDPYQRFMLRIVLALMSRPHAALVVVDDIDQLRSLTLRAQLLTALHQCATTVPVVAISVNPDRDNICDHVIDLHNQQG